MTDPTSHDHLAVTTTARGFDHLPAIRAGYGGSVRVYESSAASAPHVWLLATAPGNLNEPSSPPVEAALHLTTEQAQLLAQQLMFLACNHYQAGGE